MKAPAFQFYPKQWLGDDKVMAMSWDARAMHMHLICVAWQQDPPCTLPDDDEMIKRWLGNPRRWESLKRQIFAAWKIVDGRWIQSGLLEQFERQTAYRESRKKGADARWGNNAYALSGECKKDALQSTSTFTPSTETLIDPCMFARAVLTECRIGGRDLRMVLEEIGRAEAKHGEDLEVLGRAAIESWQSYCAIKGQLEYQWGAAKFFGEGHWKTRENWPWKNGEVGPPKPAAFRLTTPEEEAQQLREGYEMWQSMSKAYRDKNPWRGEIPA